MALILEVLDPRGRDVRARMRLDGTAVTLGRGYDNDLMLDDPYVDPRHARITLDETGALVLEDLGSLNGLVLPEPPRRTARVVLRHGLAVRLGRTTIRFRDPEAPVPPALLDVRARAARTTPPGRWFTSVEGRLAVSLGAMGAVTLYTWLGSFEESSGSDALASALAFLLLGMVWAGIWAVASRVVVQRFHFLAHFSVVSAAALVILAFAVTSAWAAFVFPDTQVAEPAEVVVALVLVAALVAGHLALATTMTRQRRWRAGLMTGGVLLMLGGAVGLVEREGFSDVPEFSGVLKPFPARLLAAGTVEGFGRVAADLKDKVDALAAKE